MRATALALALVAPGAAAAQQPLAWKALPVGAEIEYSTWTCSVVSSEGMRTECRDAQERTLRFVGWIGAEFVPEGPYGALYDYVACDRGSKVTEVALPRRSQARIAALWPLVPGRTATYDTEFTTPVFYREPKTRLRTDTEVVGFETIDTPAGRFETVVVTREMKVFCSLGGSEAFARTQWISTDLGIPVRERAARLPGFRDGEERTFELVRLTMPDGAVVAGEGPQGPPRAAAPAAGPGARGVALVIGNAAYAFAPPLRNPANDARLMAATLEELGFEVVAAVDADAATMGDAIDTFLDLSQGATSSLLYYAGHGVQSAGTNYLLPVDAEIGRPSHVRRQGFSLSGILRDLSEAGAGTNIVILDACRNNPFPDVFGSEAQGLARLLAPQNTYVAFAAAPGAVAVDGEGANSPFTRALATAMTRPGLSLDQVFTEVRRTVQEASASAQIPVSFSSLIYEFSFNPEPPP